MSDYAEAMISLAEMLPQESADPRVRAIANEVGRLGAALAAAERERDERKWMEDGGTWEDRAKAAEAEVSRLNAAVLALQEGRAGAEAALAESERRVAELRGLRDILREMVALAPGHGPQEWLNILAAAARALGAEGGRHEG